MDDQDTGQPTTPNVDSLESTDLPPKTTEDDLLQSATAGMVEAEQDQPTPPPTRVTTGTVTKSHKKLWISLLIIVVLGALGGGAYALFMKKDSPQENNASQQQQNKEEEEKAALDYKPDLVAYLHRDNQSQPNVLFNRPTLGGERREVLKFQQDENTVMSDAFGQEVVIASDSKLYVSRDGGRKYDVVYTHDTSDMIVSVSISKDGSRIAFATVPSVQGASATSGDYGALYSIDLDGKDRQKIANSTDKALLLVAWNAEQGKIIYSEGCYGCDGARTAYKLYDIEQKKAEDLLPGKDVSLFHYGIKVSDDLTQAIYIQAPTGSSAMEVAPPYQVRVVSLKDMEDTLVQSVGTQGELNPNGTPRYWNFALGFLAGTNTPYYTVDSSLYQVVDGEPVLIAQTDMPIGSVYYASATNIILTTRNTPSDEAFFLNNYDVAKEESTQIFEGDYNTLVFGISTT